jgi:hypothetical protein
MVPSRGGIVLGLKMYAKGWGFEWVSGSFCLRTHLSDQTAYLGKCIFGQNP